MTLTAPHEASVVTVANSAEADTPKRTSLPSMLPSGCVDGQPAHERVAAAPPPSSRRRRRPTNSTAMAPKMAQPCLVSLAMWP